MAKDKSKVEQYCDVYHKREGDLIFKKDGHLSMKSLAEIDGAFKKMQIPDSPGDFYLKLEDIKEKKGSLIYRFKSVPGYDSIAIREDRKVLDHYYKIVPKLKIVQGEQN